MSGGKAVVSAALAAASCTPDMLPLFSTAAHRAVLSYACRTTSDIVVFLCCPSVPAVTPGKYTLFDGFAHLASGLSCGLAGLAAGMAIGIVGDAGVR